MTYRVVFTDAARQDLDEIADFIANLHSVQQALHVVREIRKRVETLKVFPDRGTHLPELVDLGAGSTMDYRQLLWKPWRIVYFVSGRVVSIMLIADGRRDMPALLMKRLVRP
jgi:toxin ParE1/3/4